MINFNHRHSNMATLFRDDGDHLTLIADDINSTSSFVLDDKTLYYTDGIGQGPWSSTIQPKRLYTLAYTDSTAKVQSHETTLSSLNRSVLLWQGKTLYAITPEGKRQAVF